MPKIEFNDSPPEDETPAEKQLRFFTNGMARGVHDKQTGKYRGDPSRASDCYAKGYTTGYDVTPKPGPTPNQIWAARRCADDLSDNESGEEFLFMGVPLSEFTPKQVRKIYNEAFRRYIISYSL